MIATSVMKDLTHLFLTLHFYTPWTGAFLWILQNFPEHLSHRTPLGDCSSLELFHQIILRESTLVLFVCFCFLFFCLGFFWDPDFILIDFSMCGKICALTSWLKFKNVRALPACSLISVTVVLSRLRWNN